MDKRRCFHFSQEKLKIEVDFYSKKEDNLLLRWIDKFTILRIMRRIVLFCFFAVQLLGCSSYQPFSTNQYSWQWNRTSPHNPIFVEHYDHEFLWAVLTGVVDSHFEIKREMPIRLYGDVLTEGLIETEPKIGAGIAEPWHADSVGFRERLHCTLQTIRRRAEVRAVPETGGYTIEVKVFKELEDNSKTLQSSTNTASLRFKEDTDRLQKEIDVEDGAANWFIIERDAAMEERMLIEIAYRLKNPSSVIRQPKEPMR